TCRDKHLPVWQPIPSSILGLTLTRLGRVEEGLALLDAGVRLSEELGINAYLALWTVHLGEGLVVAGLLERAPTVAQRALDMARIHHEAGHEAWAQWLLGEVLAARSGGDTAGAEAHYRAALALAEELGLRPLVARIHLGLARLARRAG